MADIELKKGDTLEWAVEVNLNGSAADISDWAARVQFRKDPSTLFVPTLVYTDPANGIITISATSTQTNGLDLGEYQIDIEFTTGAGLVVSTNTFTLLIKQDITRD